MKKTFYITTTLPYVNSIPHMGHALEFVQADIIARYKRKRDYEVFFNTGTDEHGIKIYKKAIEEGKNVKDYVDKNAEHFKELLSRLHISNDAFIRTTDERHKKAAQEFWIRCRKNGYIEKRLYKGKYCIGCELEKTDSELVNGRCEFHPNLDIEIIEEENYFFKFSEFQEHLLKIYENKDDFVLPKERLNEIKSFVKMGLTDFSISRLKEKMPWGVGVPDDDEHVMYVWFDALVNYISTLGWPEDLDTFKKFWGTKDSPNAVQIAGKDNLRQQSAMWQAMLIAADLPTSKQILIHGFITSKGRKMSKSLGNVVDPIDIINEYGTDALRYFLAREVNMFEDSDMTKDRFKEAYNAGLANGLGNLVRRTMKMAEEYLDEPININNPSDPSNEKYFELMDSYELQKTMDYIWEKIGDTDEFISKNEPFKKIKTDPQKAKKDISFAVKEIYEISDMLSPFMPETSNKIINSIKENKIPELLFKRKE